MENTISNTAPVKISEAEKVFTDQLRDWTEIRQKAKVLLLAALKSPGECDLFAGHLAGVMDTASKGERDAIASLNHLPFNLGQ